MKQTATQLVALILLASFLLGAAVSYMIFVDSSSARQDADNSVSSKETGGNDKMCMKTTPPICPTAGPTPAFPVKLPPLPHGHTIEVGVEFDQVIRK